MTDRTVVKGDMAVGALFRVILLVGYKCLVFKWEVA